MPLVGFGGPGTKYDGLIQPEGGLNVKILGFDWEIGGIKGTYSGESGLTLTDNQTNYIYLDAAGARQVSIVGYPATIHLQIGRVQMVGGVPTVYDDDRVFLTTATPVPPTVEAWTIENVKAKVALALETTATIIVTGTNPGDLQTAISGASDGDIIEVQTNATYSPIVLPNDKTLWIKAGPGFGPRLTGTRCIQIADGATGHIVYGFGFYTYTTPNANYHGAGIDFETQNSKCHQIIFDSLHFEEVTAGSAVMLSYHWSVGGDLYYNPPQPSELSDRIAFLNCTFYRACKDGNEGAELALRAFDLPIIYNCRYHNDGLISRGIQLQNCTNCWISDNGVFDTTGANGEGIKIDAIGTPIAVFNTGRCFDNVCRTCTEGIDIDDAVGFEVWGNQCIDCSGDGISIDGGTPNGRGLLIDNFCWRCGNGITVEAAAICELAHNDCTENTTDYNILNGYVLPPSNLTTGELIYSNRLPHKHAESHSVGSYDPISLSDLSSPRIRLTPDGGFAVLLANNVANPTLPKGTVVKCDPNNDNSIVICGATDINPIGVVYEGITNGTSGWVVVSGRVEVLVDGNCNRNDWLGMNGTAGRYTPSASPADNVTHFREGGHALTARVGAGLVFAIIHFN